jgi:hypothetical protein
VTKKRRPQRKKPAEKPRRNNRAVSTKKRSASARHRAHTDDLPTDPFTISFIKGLTARLRADSTGRSDLSVWDEVQLRPVSPPPDLSGLTIDETTDAIKSWFYANFEDPVENTPWDEGEYVYIWGGPYQADDIINSAFGGFASEKLLEAVISEIENEGLNWVPNSGRTQAPEDLGREAPDPPDPRALHAAMLHRIATLESALAQVEMPRRGIGDNNPPEPIDFDGVTPTDLREVEAAIAVLKSQPAVPAARPNDAERAVSTLRFIASRLSSAAAATGRYFAKQADTFITAAAKEAGKRAVQSPFWFTIITKIAAVADAAAHWLNSLGSPF